MTDRSPQILVIDSEQHQLDSICRGLLLYGYRCTGVQSIEAVEDDHFSLVLIDQTQQNCARLERIERIRKKWPHIPIVVIMNLAVAKEKIVLERNIFFLKKPFNPERLDAVIRQALGQDSSNK